MSKNTCRVDQNRMGEILNPAVLFIVGLDYNLAAGAQRAVMVGIGNQSIFCLPTLTGTVGIEAVTFLVEGEETEETTGDRDIL